MKVWGVLATILFLASAAAAGWFYAENSNLKKDQSSQNQACQEEKSKIDSALEKVDTLSIFAENYFVNSANSSTLDQKISEIDDRNLQVAYENLKKAAQKDQLVAIGNFLSEYARVLGESLGGEVSTFSGTDKNNESQNQTKTPASSQIQGEGDYSDNIFPK